MIYVPAGTFIRGRMNSEDGRTASAKEPLAEKAKVDAFYMDRFEWDNTKGGHPLVNVTYDKAAELCASVGKRLCTADEWEHACKGPENRMYTYGDTFVPETCGSDVAPDADRDERSDYVSGSLEGCTSGFGAYDLSGGPREWTSTEAASNARFRILKGGKPGEAVKGSRCAYVEERSSALTDRGVSFRCCLSDGASSAGAAPADGATPATPAPAPVEGTPPG
jgi:formylglycine-generating enzyme required for sulfatase activity